MDDLLQQGITAHKAGKLDEARKIFITILKQNQDNERAWGGMYEVSGNDKERVYCLEQILRINPNHEKAKQMLDTLAGQNLPFEPAQKNNGTPVAQTGNTQKQSDADLRAQNADQWYIKGKQLSDLGNYEEAIRCFENVLQLEPLDAFTWCEKAFCEENLGLTLDAIQSYKQVLEFYDEPGLLQNAVARLAELEREEPPSINLKENIGSKNPRTDQEITEQRADTTYQPGDVIGQKYEVRDVLGSGGFGDVYLVYDREIQEICALKTLHNEFLDNARIIELFKKEANIVVNIGYHPHLVQTRRVIEVSGRLFIAMEYIAPNEQGINSLAGYLQNHLPDLIQSLRWAIQICFGMAYAYSKGIRAHRDLKPENIMIHQNGKAKVTDFGLAGILDAIPANSAKQTDNIGVFGKTQRGVGFGTPTHMPPEQFIDSASCDQRSDIYAFGVILFQMASGGELPFWTNPPKNDWQDWFQLHNEATVPRLDSPLLPIIHTCLEKKPDKRYQSFAQLRSDLELMLKQQNGEVINDQPLTLFLMGEQGVAKVVQMGDHGQELGGVSELCNKAASLETLGRHEEAIRYYDEALQIEPHNVIVLNNKGNTLNGLGRHEEAINYYDKALEIDPGYVGALNNKGFSLVNLGRYEEAILYFDKALEIDPRHENALHNRANSLHSLGHDEEAIRYFDKVLEINPRNVFALGNKASSLDSLGRYEEAISYYDKAIEIAPRFMVALRNKSFSLFNIGCYEEAVHCCEKFLEVYPNDKGMLDNKANGLDGLGRYEEAILYYDKALEIDPRSVATLSNKGDCLYKTRRYEEAICYCDKALEIDPHNVFALLNKANCLDELGRYEEAIYNFDKALEIDPYYEPALNNKGNRLKDLGRYEEAIRCFEQALTINGDSENLSGIAVSLFNMMTVYARQGKLFIALPLAQQAAQLCNLLDNPMKNNAKEVIAQIKDVIAFPLDEIIEKIQTVSSPTELQAVLMEYPIMMNPDALDIFWKGIPDVVPPHARLSYRQHLEWLLPVVNNMAKSAHEVLFHQVHSLAKLHLAIKQYPFMIDHRFIQVAEEVINGQIPSQDKPPLVQLLNWLKQIASQG